MSFDVLANPRTGEYGVLRRPAAGGHAATVADLYAGPGAAVPFEHVHPGSAETFTVVRGHLGLSVDGHKSDAGPGTRVTVPAGTAHAWWNDGDETAWVVVEVDPGARFEKMLRNMFLLAADGKTDAHGHPGLLQAALTAREFDDVHRLVRPPRPVQKLLFAALAPIARARGLRGSYPEYDHRVTEVLDEIEALPPEILDLLPDGTPAGTSTAPPPATERTPK
jgi:quercetin dioxygenase-like cupin family protein